MSRGKHTNHVRGSRHPRWNDGRMITDEGYVKVRVGVGHPLADCYGYAYEHLIVWAASGRRLPRADELLHHENEDKADNRLSNLKRIKRARHSQIHAAESERDSHGRFMARSAA